MSELDDFLAAHRADWIKAGQPSPTVTIAMVQEIERLRAALSDLMIPIESGTIIDGVANRAYRESRQAEAARRALTP